MAKHNEVGRIGEGIAKEFLIGKGFIFVSANYRKVYGEIDLIFKDISNKLVFVEVKTVSWETPTIGNSSVSRETRSLEFGAAKRVSQPKDSKTLYSMPFYEGENKETAPQKTQRQISVRGETPRPEENIHPQKIQRLKRVIQTYLVSHEMAGDWQFDVIAVFLDQKNKNAKIRHLKNIILEA